MSEAFYTANLSRTQGRSTWAIIFRHPKRTDPTTGKEGLRVRQSLKTDVDHEAAKLRDDMNVLLSSPHLWDLGAREQALGTLDPRVVDIFYYKLEGGETDFLSLREMVIAMPSAQTGEYRRALLLGTPALVRRRCCARSSARTRSASASPLPPPRRRRFMRPRSSSPKATSGPS